MISYRDLYPNRDKNRFKIGDRNCFKIGEDEPLELEVLELWLRLSVRRPTFSKLQNEVDMEIS